MNGVRLLIAVVILAGYADRMAKFYESNPGFRSRIAHHIDFPDYTDEELLRIAEMMLEQQNYRFSPKARDTMAEYIKLRRAQPHFANARSIRNALDRTRLRHANRLLDGGEGLATAEQLSTLEEADVRQSRVFSNNGVHNG